MAKPSRSTSAFANAPEQANESAVQLARAAKTSYTTALGARQCTLVQPSNPGCAPPPKHVSSEADV